jgi:hypothetical protein
MPYFSVRNFLIVSARRSEVPGCRPRRRRVGVAGNTKVEPFRLARTAPCRVPARRTEALADVGRVVVEVDFEIDLRLARGDLRDFLALAERERPVLRLRSVSTKLVSLALRRCPRCGAGREAAGRRLRLQASRILSAETVSAGTASPPSSTARRRCHDRKYEAGHCPILMLTPASWRA